MTTDLTTKPMRSAQNTPLQAGYGAWADTLPSNARVVICLHDPFHALAAFFGILSTGRICGVASVNIAQNLPDDFIILNTPCAPITNALHERTATRFITFSGGTTGTPKAILRSTESWIYSFDRNGITADDRVAVLGYLSHSLAFYGAAEAAFVGAKIAFLSPRAKLCNHDINVIYATPTQLKILCQQNAINLEVKHIFVGGGALSANDHATLSTYFPNAVIKVFYGAAETSFVTISDATTPTGSVGKPYIGVDVQIRNGGVFVNSPMNATRYLTSDTAVVGSDGYVDVGELGHFDTAGNLFITGRRDRAINIADQLVHLDEIERAVLANDGVEYAGVIAIRDDLRGHQLACAICGDVGRMNDIKHLSKRRIFTIDDWPTLPSGKTDYRRITALIKDRMT
ncbi:hypothetical protein GCM10008927_08810 [Amylibacter ulvae]|uniref:AMP-dependent synthetase/ligase domain-containing protein n=1 Tax=Paramylibacter ulvae TaxID=1651968 RepID=A0ABQ3CWC1_9RHOB|nr:AMP-binding protein [Amylibacter ulvae]GHA45921.1 hypothetical protein GCM10008927_08810 [Amylibacter ulvae]